MIIGVPRERKTLEKRVAITPYAAAELIKAGHTVLVERDAGLGSHFSNDDFGTVGCTIADSLRQVWSDAELVLKVKEPHEEEFEFFREDLLLFDYLHLASLPTETDALLKGGVTALAYELVQTSDGRLPLLEPMSEVAGKLSILNGAHALLAQNGGRGVLLGGTIGVPPRRVTIVGAGIAGLAACEMALGMGAIVTVLDISVRALERVKHQFQNRARTVYSTQSSLFEECSRADLVIGAVLVPGAAAPKLVTREIVKNRKNGAAIVDISIDQGGCVETMRPTSLDSPTYVEEGVIHYAVTNMPAQTPRTSTMALVAATLPYIKRLAGMGFIEAMEQNPALRNSLHTHKGQLTNAAVAKSLNLSYTSIEAALSGKERQGE